MGPEGGLRKRCVETNTSEAETETAVRPVLPCAFLDLGSAHTAGVVSRKSPAVGQRKERGSNELNLGAFRNGGTGKAPTPQDGGARVGSDRHDLSWSDRVRRHAVDLGRLLVTQGQHRAKVRHFHGGRGRWLVRYPQHTVPCRRQEGAALGRLGDTEAAAALLAAQPNPADLLEGGAGRRRLPGPHGLCRWRPADGRGSMSLAQGGPHALSTTLLPGWRAGVPQDNGCVVRSRRREQRLRGRPRRVPRPRDNDQGPNTAPVGGRADDKAVQHRGRRIGVPRAAGRGAGRRRCRHVALMEGRGKGQVPGADGAVCVPGCQALRGTRQRGQAGDRRALVRREQQDQAPGPQAEHSDRPIRATDGKVGLGSRWRGACKAEGSTCRTRGWVERITASVCVARGSCLAGSATGAPEGCSTRTGCSQRPGPVAPPGGSWRCRRRR